MAPEPFSNHLHCPHCDISYRDPVPNIFSFNSPLGACETCKGFGRVIDIDIDLVIPNPGKSLSRRRHQTLDQPQAQNQAAARLLRAQENPDEKALGRTERHAAQLVIDGAGEYKGIRGWFRRLERRKLSHACARLAGALPRLFALCPECNGTRLKADALNYRIDGKDVAQISAMNVGVGP